MTNEDKGRIAIFLGACIGSRLALAYGVGFLHPEKNTTAEWIIGRGVSFLLLLISLGFFVIFAFGLRKTGIETGGERIWWNALRPVHALVFALAAYYVWNLRGCVARSVLLFDVAIGLVAYSVRRLCVC